MILVLSRNLKEFLFLFSNSCSLLIIKKKLSLPVFVYVYIYYHTLSACLKYFFLQFLPSFAWFFFCYLLFLFLMIIIIVFQNFSKSVLNATQHNKSNCVLMGISHIHIHTCTKEIISQSKSSSLYYMLADKHNYTYLQLSSYIRRRPWHNYIII